MPSKRSQREPTRFEKSMRSLKQRKRQDSISTPDLDAMIETQRVVISLRGSKFNGQVQGAKRYTPINELLREDEALKKKVEEEILNRKNEELRHHEEELRRKKEAHQKKMLKKKLEQAGKVTILHGLNIDFWKEILNTPSSTSEPVHSVVDIVNSNDRSEAIIRADHYIEQLKAAYNERFLALRRPETRFVDRDDACTALHLFLFLTLGVVTVHRDASATAKGRLTRKFCCQLCGAGVSSVTNDPDTGLFQVKRFMEEASGHICLQKDIRAHLITKINMLRQNKGEPPIEKDDVSHSRIKLLLLFERLCGLPGVGFSVSECTSDELLSYKASLSRLKLLLHVTGISRNFNKDIAMTLIRVIGGANYAEVTPDKSTSQGHLDSQTPSQDPQGERQIARVTEFASKVILRLQGPLADPERLEELGSIQIKEGHIDIISEGLSDKSKTKDPRSTSRPLILRDVIPRLNYKSLSYTKECSLSLDFTIKRLATELFGKTSKEDVVA